MRCSIDVNYKLNLLLAGYDILLNLANGYLQSLKKIYFPLDVPRYLDASNLFPTAGTSHYRRPHT
jgi:hypothetical protein